MNTDQLTRAAARIRIGTPAKKLDLIVYEIPHSVTTCNSFKTETRIDYQLGLVVGVSREGEVTSYKDRGGHKCKGRPSKLSVVSRERLRPDCKDTESILLLSPIWKDLDEARTWLRQYI